MQSRSDKKIKMWWCYIFHAKNAKSAEFGDSSTPSVAPLLVPPVSGGQS